MDDGSNKAHAALPGGEDAERLTPNDFGPDTRGVFHTLKDGDLFAVFAETGDMNGPDAGPAEAFSKDGLFLRDTRVLSRLVLTINGARLIPLGIEAFKDPVVFHADLGNARLRDGDGAEFAAYSIHVSRERFLSDGLYETVTVTNYGLQPARLDLVFDCFADFRDIFEVRGVQAAQRGGFLPPHRSERGLAFAYESVDGVVTQTEILFDRPVVTNGGRVHHEMLLEPGRSETLALLVTVTTRRNGDAEPAGPAPAAARPGGEVAIDAASALADRRERFDRRAARLLRIGCDQREFDGWLARSATDLAMLIAETPSGPYPHAGVPWFAAPFGRDAIVTALQTLWLDPTLSAGVLEFLAATQATDVDDASERQPGKILHETRDGEMARTGQVPFRRYYGGVDQTLLFVMLAGAYLRRTADLARIRRLAPAVDAALDWARLYGDSDGDGFVEYARLTDKGLRNQGWKDSDDALFHADGALCEGPIALVEVQGYHVAALRAGAEIAAALGDAATAQTRRQAAEDLVGRIDAAFWDDGLGVYAMALDGAKRRVAVRSSNVGHMLYAEAMLPGRVATLAESVQSPELMTGWGVRTIAAGAARYNPMRYHNGTIWPHDNSLIAAGLARFGCKQAVRRITASMFDAACSFPQHRLPELWCGFSRRVRGQPISYPSACAPQAWSAGTAFLCVAACLGVEVDAVSREVRVRAPVLPEGLRRLELAALPLGDGVFDMAFELVDDSGAARALFSGPSDLRMVLLDGQA